MLNMQHVKGGAPVKYHWSLYHMAAMYQLLEALDAGAVGGRTNWHKTLNSEGKVTLPAGVHEEVKFAGSETVEMVFDGGDVFEAWNSVY